MADWKRRAIGDLPVYQAATLAWLPGIVQGFTTRHAGVSPPPYNSMNLGAHVGDDPAAVETNRVRLWQELGFSPQRVALAEQVHGSRVAVVTEGGLDAVTDVDALVTNRTDLLLMLFFADCVPVYIVDPVSRAVALAHAGWRGTICGVVAQTVEALRTNFGSRPGTCLAAVGPCIGGESYEVGQEVADQFRRLDTLQSANALLPKDEFRGTYTLNLRQVIYSQLLDAGFRSEYIFVSGEDTYRNRRDFFSFRRDGKNTGRMAGFLALRSR